MKLAFSTVACPTWDFETIVSKAKAFGYDGVELCGPINSARPIAANPFSADSAKVRDLFANAGLPIACLSSSLAFANKRKTDQHLAADLVCHLDTARALGCSLVRILDTQVRPGQSSAAVAAAMANWLIPLADRAAELGVTILVENALSFRQARDLWMMLEMLNHPAVAVCWDVCNAALAGEAPAISVPTLNQRMRYVQVADAVLSAQAATLCKLGEGNVRVQELCQRLQGIGYNGWVCFEWDKTTLPNLAEPDEVLPDAAAKLRQWTQPPAPPEVKKVEKKAPAQPVAATA